MKKHCTQPSFGDFNFFHNEATVHTAQDGDCHQGNPEEPQKYLLRVHSTLFSTRVPLFSGLEIFVGHMTPWPLQGPHPGWTWGSRI